MAVRTIVVAAAVAVALSFPMAGVAAAQQDRDCTDFATPAEAQAVYNQNRADPNGLDLDKDGLACEALPGGAPGSAEGSILATGTVAPRGGVETGAGGTADDRADGAAAITGDGSGPLLPLGLMGGAVLAAAGLVLLDRRSPKSDRRER